MIAPDPRRVPVGAAIGQGLFAIMEIVFHLGAHRTGSTTFQSYMHDNIRVLEDGDIAYWGPKTTRKGLFRGLIPTDPANEGQTATQERAEARVARHLEEAAKSGTAAILVSEENMIGSVRGCVRAGALYPDVGARLACYARAFDGDVTRIALAIRSQDRFWASALAFAVGRGHPVPGRKKLAQIARSQRSWRDIITDLACAVPSAEIRVLPYESFYANPITFAHQAARLDVALRGRYGWLNQAPDLPTLRKSLAERGRDATRLPEGDGLWEPFSREDAAAMREQYADDLFWLAEGASGLAKLTEEAMPRERGQARRVGTMRGHYHDGPYRLDKAG